VTITAAAKHPAFSLLDRQRLQTWQRKLYAESNPSPNCFCPPSSPCRHGTPTSTTSSSGRRRVARAHRLREDDAVMLLVELFRIHQRHWDELRRREIPSFEQFRATSRSSRKRHGHFREQSAALLEATAASCPRPIAGAKSPAPPHSSPRWQRLAGYLIGRAWP
jgi:hypothetical protein